MRAHGRERVPVRVVLVRKGEFVLLGSDLYTRAVCQFRHSPRGIFLEGASLRRRNWTEKEESVDGMVLNPKPRRRHVQEEVTLVPRDRSRCRFVACKSENERGASQSLCPSDVGRGAETATSAARAGEQ